MKISIIILALLTAGACPAEARDEILLVVGEYDHGAKNIQALADLGVGNMIWIPKPNLIQDGNIFLKPPLQSSAYS
jgi:hypothetical protein